MNGTYRAVSSIVLRRLPSKEIAHQDTNLKDIYRKPTELLYLVVKKPRVDHAWQFPQGGQDPGETGPEAALRELREECGSDLQVNLIDTVHEAGIYQYPFPAHFKRSIILSS
ncbi:RNA pyrophosphohydrolase [Choanephora cucurbitarum]|uniref:RNA pyrophosphohydrolase n=1 Tax=Choanephora cucurbitarum TaxID=101091 RepID=A0A1C7N4Y7_9FUNG|nr:RNA pyrophosphohydrolase [Choanephora cucurbitarum]